MRRIQIRHVTEYRYAEPVRLQNHRLLVRPREGHDLRIESSRLDITPSYSIVWYRDVHGNSVASVDFKTATAQLTITSQVVVQHYGYAPEELAVAQQAEFFPFHYDPMEQIDLVVYLLAAYPQDSAALGAWLDEVWRPGQRLSTATLLNTINRKIADEIRYEVREEPGVYAPGQTLTRRRGSCRDMATLFIEACRYCGVAARFVSGYLLSSAAVRDTTTTHAWSEVYLPGTGWLGFDSTSGLMVGGEHVAVAVHRHPEAVPPVAGSFVGPPEPKPEMSVHVTATAL